MALAAATSAIKIHPTFLQTSLPPNPLIHRRRPNSDVDRNTTPLSISCSSSNKIIRIRPLDRAATKHNKLRFATKLKTLLSKPPHHSLPLSVLFKCRRYLSLNPSHRTPLPDMVSRYPLLFRNPDTDALSVRLSPEALRLAADESATRSKLSSRLATTLHKLLMLSRPRCLLLDKLVHLAPDLGLPPNFRSRLANEHPERFRVVSTSYGRSLELVAWDSELAVPFPRRYSNSSFHDGEPIIDRPPRFRKLNLPRGMNLKRRHRNYLFKIGDLPEVSPYDENLSNEGNDYGCGEDLLAEKRACAVVREVLSMTVEKRTLVDHITHFRHEFGLSNKVRSMLIRHPELFYVSPKGIRDSVFLVEGYDDKGRLLVERDDGLMEMKDKLIKLVREGKRLRRVRERGLDYGVDEESESEDEEEVEGEDEGMEEVMKIGEMGDDWEEVGVLEGGEGFTDDDGGGGEEERRKFWSLRELEDKEGGGLVVLEPW